MLVIRFGTLDFEEKERKAIVDLVSADEPQLTMGKRAMFIFWASLAQLFVVLLKMCESMRSMLNGKKLGSRGLSGCFSFYRAII